MRDMTDRTIEWMSEQHRMKDKNNRRIEQYRMNDR